MTNKEPEMYERREASPAVEPGLSPLWQQHLKDLADHIAQDLALLKDCEDALRYEDDPRPRAKYLRGIEQLHEAVARHKQEYDELEAQIAGRPPAEMQDIAAKLQQMGDKLEVRRLRQRLLDHYEADEQSTVAIPVEYLDQTHSATVQAMLDALEAGRIPDALIHQALDAVQRVLVTLSERNIALPGRQAVANAIAAPTLGLRHKLKLTLPIVPALLSHEGELGPGSEAKLATMWRQLITKARGVPLTAGCKVRIGPWTLKAEVAVFVGLLVLVIVVGLCGMAGWPVIEQQMVVWLRTPPAPQIVRGGPVALVRAGEAVVFRASVEGASRYEWTLGGVGEISGNGGPAILYTAPEEGGVALLTVTAYNAQGASPATSLTIKILGPLPCTRDN